jgi:hypothetical protein
MMLKDFIKRFPLVWHTLNVLKVLFLFADNRWWNCCGCGRVSLICLFMKWDLHCFKSKFNVYARKLQFSIKFHGLTLLFVLSFIWFLKTATGSETKAKQQLYIFRPQKKRLLLLSSLTYIILNLKLLTYLSYQVTFIQVKCFAKLLQSFCLEASSSILS